MNPIKSCMTMFLTAVLSLALLTPAWSKPSTGNESQSLRQEIVDAYQSDDEFTLMELQKLIERYGQEPVIAELGNSELITWLAGASSAPVPDGKSTNNVSDDAKAAVIINLATVMKEANISRGIVNSFISHSAINSYIQSRIPDIRRTVQRYSGVGGVIRDDDDNTDQIDNDDGGNKPSPGLPSASPF